MSLRIKDAVSSPVHYTNEVVCKTNVRVPEEESYPIWISEDIVKDFQKMIDENPDYFIDEGITEVHILKPELFVARHLWHYNHNITVDAEEYVERMDRMREKADEEKAKEEYKKKTGLFLP